MLDKRKRGFFNESVGAWLAAGDGEIVDRVLLGGSPAPTRRSSTRRRAARGARAGGRATSRQAPLLLSLVMLELWLGDYLPRAFALAREPAVSAA